MNHSLRSLVDERGLRQDWLAQELGVSETRLSRWLSGAAQLPISHVERLASIFAVPTDIVVTAANHSRNTAPD